MNGPTDTIYVFDTNAVIGHLSGKSIALSTGIRFISEIAEMELLAKPNASPDMKQQVHDFLESVIIIPFSGEIKREAIAIRRDGLPRPKLPDAIIAATAVVLDAKLVTADDRLCRLVWPGFNAIQAFNNEQ
jgi:predicted nucleic acid-binding protein